MSTKLSSWLLLLVMLSLGISPLHSAQGHPEEPGSRVLGGLQAPMRDGVTLQGDVVLPTQPGRYPVILEITPYGRGPGGINYRDYAPYWNSRGYAFAVFDARGLGGSGGKFPFMKDGPDGYDLVEWLARQPWSTGAVAMLGSSYTGGNQWRIAKEQPPSLKCITPAAVWDGPFGTVPYGGGAFTWNWAATWPALLSDSGVQRTPPDYEGLLKHRPLATLDSAIYGRPLALFQEFIRHPTLDEYWQTKVVAPEEFARVQIPTLSVTGYLDEMHPGTTASFREVQSRSPARAQHWLLIGPWEHATVVGGGRDNRKGNQPVRTPRGFDLPDHAFPDTREIYGRFFNWCLRGGPKFEQAPVHLYVTGSNRWLEFDTYPPRSARVTPLYLQSNGSANGLRGDGKLTWKPAKSRGASDRYVYDPRNPVGRTHAGPEPVDLAAEIDRPDVLVYVTEPLARPLTVVGNVQLVLDAATDGRDTDWAVRLEDVAPDGKGTRIGTEPAAVFRARYREGFDREVLLEPGKAYEYTIDLNDIGHTFRAGHRLRLSVTSSMYPWIHPNPNTGNPIATDAEQPRIANQSVFHDRARPSRLLLPVLPET